MGTARSLQKNDKNNPCPHCGKRQCYTHCYSAKDGKHVVDSESCSRCLDYLIHTYVIDFNCKLCGQGGSASVDLDDITWD